MICLERRRRRRCCSCMNADLVLKIVTVLVFVGIAAYSFAINWH